MRSLNALCLICGLIFALFYNLPALAEPKAKSKYDTKIFEAEQTNSQTAKVRTFKESRGDTLVYFEDLKKSGPYVLPESIRNYAVLKNMIAESAKTGGPKVTFTFDDQDN